MYQLLQGEFGAALGKGPPTEWGQWLSAAFVKFEDDGRRVELWDTLMFRDKRGVLHTVPVGFVSDGASIPKAAWSLVGGPLSGRYRRAAILHDWALDTGMDTDAAHDLFHDAMRADGVTEEQAEQFFAAVALKSLWDRLPILKVAVRAVRRLLRF